MVPSLEDTDLFHGAELLSDRSDIEGEMTGGNLSLIYSLIGTKAEPKTRGRILFIRGSGRVLLPS